MGRSNNLCINSNNHPKSQEIFSSQTTSRFAVTAFVILAVAVLNDNNCKFHPCTALVTAERMRSLLSPFNVNIGGGMGRSKSSSSCFLTALTAASASKSSSSSSSSTTSTRLFENSRQRSFTSSSFKMTEMTATKIQSTFQTSSPLFRLYYNDVYKVDLPPRHRFPMWKYERVRKRIQAILSEQQQKHAPHIIDYDFHVSPLATVEDLETTHSREYIERFLAGRQTESEQRNVGFPWSQQGVDRSLSSVGGTVAAACYVCDELRRSRQMMQPQQQSPFMPWAAHIAGGTHHAFYDYGEGFSVFSDIAVAANVVLDRYSDVIQNILVVDLDVHQGNGNAKLFESNQNVFTFSIHCDANIFSKKEYGDLDIELPAGCTDATYLVTLNHWLNRFRCAHFNALDERTEASDDRKAKYNRQVATTNKNNKVNRNDAFKIDMIFFQAGVDILDDDRLGRMDISPLGLQRRNEMVYQFAFDLNVPLIITMGGGYPRLEEGWDKLIDAHSNVYVQAFEFLKRQQRQNHSKNSACEENDEGVNDMIVSGRA